MAAELARRLAVPLEQLKFTPHRDKDLGLKGISFGVKLKSSSDNISQESGESASTPHSPGSDPFRWPFPQKVGYLLEPTDPSPLTERQLRSVRPHSNTHPAHVCLGQTPDDQHSQSPSALRLSLYKRQEEQQWQL